MKLAFAFLIAAVACAGVAGPLPSSTFAAVTTQLTDEILGHGRAYDDLVELTQSGSRLSGSEGAQRAVEWARAKLESLHLDRVYLQPVQVPRWTRGRETAWMRTGLEKTELHLTALGKSPGTPPAGMDAPVIEVQSLEEVTRLGSRVRGKIIFYNRAMDDSLEDKFEAYAHASDQRMAGPAHAERFGAVAVLVRSLTNLADDDTPHTGTTRRTDIPAAALSTHAANILSRALRANPGLTVHLELGCANHDPVTSYNVIGEITGAERPHEYVVVGGHLDSWDLGPGAHDDGAGVVQSIEVLRAIQKLGLRPRRSVRAVLFMSEEVGALGALEYAAQARRLGERHILAIESDRGGFSPRGFEGQAGALELVRPWLPYLTRTGATRLTEGESGTDVSQLDGPGVATLDFVPVSTDYFRYHHSALDVVSTVNPEDLRAGAAAMAVLAYLGAQDF